MIKLLAALAATQILGWGTTFYIPAVLGQAAIAAHGFPRALVFGGVTIMYVVGGLASPAVGRFVERHGARAAMMAGSGLAAAALAWLAFAATPWAWVLGWIAIGLVMPLALSNTAFVAVAQAALQRGIPARRPIGALALATGLAISFAFPLGTLASERLGYQGALLAFAAVNLLVCLPLHATLPRGPPPSGATEARDSESRVPPHSAARVMLLLAIAFTIQGFCIVALELHLLTLLTSAGATPALAVSLAALSGPIRVSARVADMALARRFSALATGIAAMALLPPALLCLAAGGVPGAIAFVVLWSASMGVSTIARAAVPLELFGAAGYATRLGKLTLPVNLGQALGPVSVAALLDAAGFRPVVWLALCFAVSAVVALALVRAFTRRD